MGKEKPSIQTNEKTFDLLFHPNNLVIYDAKPNISFFIEGFLRQNFATHNLYLVSSTNDELLGVKCYQSIEDLPVNIIDLLILSVRREVLIKSLKAIFTKLDVKFIHIFTAGTGEADEVGMRIEKELKNLLDSKPNTRAIGPNCMGIYSPKGNIAYYSSFPEKSGNIGLIFQSGDLHSKFIKFGNRKYNLFFSKGVSIGNCVDIQISEILEYLNQDDYTDIICIYFEGFSTLHPNEGLNLFPVLMNMKKPVFFLRGGRTLRGKRAVVSHTGSMVSKEKIWDAIYKQTPIIKVGPSLENLLDYTFFFYKFINHFKTLKREIIFPKGKKVLVILWSGGFGILATDTITNLGLEMPLFEGKSLKRLQKIYPSKIGSLSNPLDLPWISSREEYYKVSKAAIDEKDIDLVIVETDAWRDLESERFIKYFKNLKRLRDYAESRDKIFVIILHEYPSKSRELFFEKLSNNGFLILSSVKTAAKSFLKLYEYGNKIKKKVNFKD
jgi:acyl-CoA synthetase (NDP forming)